MKIKIYADVYLGIRPENFYFFVSPPTSEPGPGCKRLSWDIDVPQIYVEGEVANLGVVEVNKRD